MTPPPNGDRSPASLLLLGHAALAIALFATNGGESLLGVLFVLAALIAWTKAFIGTIRGVAPGVDAAVRLAWMVALGSVVVSTVLVSIRPPGIYLETSATPFVLLDGCVALVLTSYRFDVVLLRSLPRRVVLARRCALFLLALAIGAWMLHASPDPKIDVFPLHQQAAQAMLAGKSMYDPGVIHTPETFQHKGVVDFYPYYPLGACLTMVAYAVTHDIRWADLVSQLVGAVLLWLAARRTAPAGAMPRREAWADLIAAMFLFHPRGPFVLEEAWTEPMAIPFLGGFVLLVLARRPMLASVCLGLFCAMKQHLFLYVPFLALAPGVGVVGVVLAGAVAVATIAPFAIGNPTGFYRGAFSTMVHYALRTDALNVPSELARVGFITPSWVGFVAWLAPLPWLRRVPRTVGALLLASSISFTLFYLFGRQAFCNYYYLLDTTVLFAAATLVD